MNKHWQSCCVRTCIEKRRGHSEWATWPIVIRCFDKRMLRSYQWGLSFPGSSSFRWMDFGDGRWLACEIMESQRGYHHGHV
jgi:hypothetical protein